jgi:hypothetical protein
MDVGAKDAGVRGGKRIGHNQSIITLQCTRILKVKELFVLSNQMIHVHGCPIQFDSANVAYLGKPSIQ